MKKRKDKDFIEFVLMDEVASSPAVVATPAEVVAPEPVETLAPSTKLEDMPPVFRELAVPKLPNLPKSNRARLQMQTPNRLFFYWSLASNPFQKLNRALGTQTASYTLVLKLVDLKRESEQIHRVEAEGSWWFDVEADGKYRAEIGFYAPNGPYVRALFSNTIETPRKSPSPRIDTEADWAVPAHKFAEVLEVAGFTEDAFDVAIAGDDLETAEATTQKAFAQLIANDGVDVSSLAQDEIRYAMLLLASGATLEDLRWKISPALFAILQAHAAALSAERALEILKQHFEVATDELTEEEIGPAVFGASLVNFPKRLKTRRTLPKLRPVSSRSSSTSHLRQNEV
jgi:hypothetical protein